MYEIEQKFRVTDLTAIRSAILNGVVVQDSKVVQQQDLYFAHPCRDFAQTDEALRIRISGSQVCITYKGPRTFHTRDDSTTKTRKETEVELNLPVNEVDKLQELFESLGFTQVRNVSKRREAISTSFDGWPVNFALDDVDELGGFVEIEVVTNRGGIEQGQECVRKISQQFGLSDPVSMSYLELLIEQDG